MMTRLHQLWQAFRRDEGTATVEFVLCVPMVMFVFMASFESGLAMVRSIMLERSLDMVIRELRLGHYPQPTNKLLKDEICKRTMMINNCAKQIKLDIQPIDRTTWQMPEAGVDCIDRTVGEVEPVVEMTIGQQNVIMLVRACVIQDAIFPFTGVGLAMKVGKGEDGYRVTSISSFVNEPG